MQNRDPQTKMPITGYYRNMRKSNRIVMALWGEIGNDYRVIKQAETLITAGYQVTVICRSSKEVTSKLSKKGLVIKSLFDQPVVNPYTFYQKLIQATFIILGQIHLLVLLCISKPSVIHAHDINTILPAVIAKIVTRARLIYDCHEFALDRVGYFNKRRLIFVIEAFALKFTNGIITVSNGTSKAYRRIYRIQAPDIIQNFPVLMNDRSKEKENKSAKLKTELQISKLNKIVLYQGGLTTGRGLHCLIRSLLNLDESILLVLLGKGPLKEALQTYAHELNVAHRVIFHDMVSINSLRFYTQLADVAVHPLENICLNHRWSSPNKIFEYIHAEVPVVMSNLYGLSHIVSRWNIGRCFAPGDSEDLANKIQTILNDCDLHAHICNNCRLAKGELNWQNQEYKLLKVYDRILSL